MELLALLLLMHAFLFGLHLLFLEHNCHSNLKILERGSPVKGAAQEVQCYWEDTKPADTTFIALTGKPLSSKACPPSLVAHTLN